MPSLTKMAPSSWTYYAEEIATGREDYHALSAERPGIFLGAGAEALGITDVAVDTTALERLFGHGEDPRDPLGGIGRWEVSRAPIVDTSPTAFGPGGYAQRSTRPASRRTGCPSRGSPPRG